jgi:hypothetical protein
MHYISMRFTFCDLFFPKITGHVIMLLFYVGYFEREAHHSPPSILELNARIITSTLPYVLVWCLSTETVLLWESG